MSYKEKAIKDTWRAFRRAYNYPTEAQWAGALKSYGDPGIRAYLKAQGLAQLGYIYLHQRNSLPQSAQGERDYYNQKAEEAFTEAIQLLEKDFQRTWLYKHVLAGLAKVERVAV